jgi:hypothetical protein
MSIDQLLEAAKLAVETYFSGEMKTKRKFAKDMTNLAAAIKAYESKQETVRIENAQRKN